MPKAPKRAADRIRKQRFCPEELQAMVDFLAEHAGVVFSSDMQRESTLRKKNIWPELAQRVSAVGNTPLMPRDCRKRWDDLRVWGLLSSNRSQALQTGGGPSTAVQLEPWEETCAALIGTESIEGVGTIECRGTTSAEGAVIHAGVASADVREASALVADTPIVGPTASRPSSDPQTAGPSTSDATPRTHARYPTPAANPSLKRKHPGWGTEWACAAAVEKEVIAQPSTVTPDSSNPSSCRSAAYTAVV
ncbi:myb-related transcription factor, partner of profilin-like [Ambystoma mexicanum]|uniref:myb-related transcription factor, partner of profilin-like n=1 Tax=Ambystoma mexicanum TaxID=8296 RepID=UPI0037E7A54C